MKHFTHKTLTVSDLFSGKTSYQVPLFQREYTWKSSEVDALWNDLKEAQAKKETHYIGSLVFNQETHESTKRKEIVDGQQRLVTFVVIYSAIRDLLYEQDAKADAQKIQDSLKLSSGPRVVPGKDLEEIYSLLLEVPSSIKGKTRSSSPSSHKNLEKNYTSVRNYFERDSEWKKLTSEQKQSRVRDVKKQVDSILVLSLAVWTDEDAFALFETLNARAVELSEVDLIKNLLFKNLYEYKDLSDIEARWTSMSRNVSGSRKVSASEIRQFVKHFWWSMNAPKISQREIFSRMKNSYDGIEYDAVLDLLVEESSIYNKTRYPEESKWIGLSRKGPEIAKHLTNIKRMGRVRQVYTVLQSLARVLHKSDFRAIKPSDFYETFEVLENFTFLLRLSTVSPSAIENIYVTTAAGIHREAKKSSKSGIKKELSNLKKALSDKKPTEQEFVQNLMDEITYDSEKDLVSYAFERLQFTRPGLRFDSESIDHIFPQNPEKGIRHYDEAFIKRLHMIGNLVPLEEDLNFEANNKMPSHKMKYIYPRSDYRLVTDLQREYELSGNWEPADIERRSKQIGENLYRLLSQSLV